MLRSRHSVTNLNRAFKFFYLLAVVIRLQEWNMGQRASETVAITFEDVVVPKEVRYLSTFGKSLLLSFSFCLIGRYFMDSTGYTWFPRKSLEVLLVLHGDS